VIKKEAEKILKYKDLTIEIRRMCNIETKVIPAITVTTGTILKSFKQYRTTYRESSKSRDYRNQPYLESKSAEHSKLEITLHTA
jgi:hypothetical protein